MVKKSRDTYTYLRDPRALAEIRKHKWIESQKAGEEVSFVTAALDWIKKYGPKWKEIHAQECEKNAVFIERRKYRRFKLNTSAELVKNNETFLVKGIDVGFFGLLCNAKEHIPLNSEVGINLPLNGDGRNRLACRGTIERVLSRNACDYALFIKFDALKRNQVDTLCAIS